MSSDSRREVMQYLDRRREETVELLRELLVRFSPSGEEQEVARFIAGWLLDAGFADTKIDQVNNVVSRLPGAEDGFTLLYNGHIDVVPVGDRSLWPHDPLQAPVVDGKVVGRGACDMKGSVAAMMVAADTIRKMNVPLKGNLVLTMVGREEGGQQEGTRYCIEEHGLKPDLAIIGEATNLNLCLGSRGRIIVEIKVKGRSAHAANSSRGVNAILQMSKLIQRIGRMSLPEHEILGKTTQTITIITCSPGQLNMVPDLCTITIDRRIAPGDSLEKTRGEFEAVVDEINSEDDTFEAEVETGKYAAPGYRPPGKETVEALCSSIRSATGREPQVTRYIFGTDGSYLAPVAGIPWFGFGPGDEANAHTVNDHVEIEDLMAAAKAYAHFILDFLS